MLIAPEVLDSFMCLVHATKVEHMRSIAACGLCPAGDRVHGMGRPIRGEGEGRNEVHMACFPP